MLSIFRRLAAAASAATIAKLARETPRVRVVLPRRWVVGGCFFLGFFDFRLALGAELVLGFLLAIEDKPRRLTWFATSFSLRRRGQLSKHLCMFRINTID